MEYIAIGIGMVSGAVSAIATNAVIWRYAAFRQRREEQRRRLQRLKERAAQTPAEICNAYAKERKKKQTIICKGIYGKELAEMIGGSYSA